MQEYSTVASRNLIDAEYKMLGHASRKQVLGSFGQQYQQPLNKSDTRVFRRVKPFNSASNETPQITATNFRASEGVTPTANTIGFTDVSLTLEQYIVLFKFSSKTQLMYEDNIPEAMTKQVGETIGYIAENVAYGQAKAGISVVYANGSTRAGLNSTISANTMRQVSRNLQSNWANTITSKISSSPNFGTVSVNPAYAVLAHPDMEADIQNLPNFKDIADYGSSFKPIHEYEKGAYLNFRFIISPLFTPFLAAGSGTINGMVSADGSNTDVYPMIVLAEDALGHLSLKGHNYTGISPTLIPSNVKTAGNPAGMFGFVGADFWYQCGRMNENFMTRIETCATALI